MWCHFNLFISFVIQGYTSWVVTGPAQLYYANRTTSSIDIMFGMSNTCMLNEDTTKEMKVRDDSGMVVSQHISSSCTIIAFQSLLFTRNSAYSLGSSWS